VFLLKWLRFHHQNLFNGGLFNLLTENVDNYGLNSILSEESFEIFLVLEERTMKAVKEHKFEELMFQIWRFEVFTYFNRLDCVKPLQFSSSRKV
jgi:hypothetical protein